MDNSSLDLPPSHAGFFQRLGWFGVGLAILGLGIGVFVLLKALKPEPRQRDLTADVPVVQTQLLYYRDSPLLIDGTGIVSPRAEVTISAQISGAITSIHPAMVSGGALQKNEVMIQVDPRTFKANAQQAEADRAAAQANFDYLQKQITRIKSLRESGFAPQENLDDVYSRRDQAEANLLRAEAVLETRRLDLERTAIRAPFSGRVLSENVDVGDIVAPGKELAKFYASDEVEVVVSLTAADAAFIPDLWQMQQSEPRRAWVTVNHGGRDYQWQGYLHRVESDLDSVTRTIDVVVRVPEPFTPGQPLQELSSTTTIVDAPPLLVGMYSRVEIEGMELEKHFVIPISALRHDNTIWIAESEGTLSVEPVEFIREEGNFAVLRAQKENQHVLVPGTPIIVSQIALVSDGMRVAPLAGSEEPTLLSPDAPESEASMSSAR